MKRAVIQIRHDQDAKAALEAMGENFVKAWNSGKASDPIATFTFSSPAQLFTVQPQAMETDRAPAKDWASQRSRSRTLAWKGCEARP